MVRLIFISIALLCGINQLAAQTVRQAVLDKFNSDTQTDFALVLAEGVDESTRNAADRFLLLDESGRNWHLGIKISGTWETLPVDFESSLSMSDLQFTNSSTPRATLEYILTVNSSTDYARQVIKLLKKIEPSDFSDASKCQLFNSDPGLFVAAMFRKLRPGLIANDAQLYDSTVIFSDPASEKRIVVDYLSKNVSRNEFDSLKSIPVNHVFSAGGYRNGMVFYIPQAADEFVASKPGDSVKFSILANDQIKTKIKSSIEYQFTCNEKTYVATGLTPDDLNAIKALTTIPHSITKNFGWLRHPRIYCLE